MLTIKSGKKGPQIKRGIIEANIRFNEVEVENFKFFIEDFLNSHYFKSI